MYYISDWNEILVHHLFISALGVRRSRVVTFAAIRLRGPGFKPRPGQKFETRFMLHSQPSGGEGVSPMQGVATRRHYIKPEYLSYHSRLPMFQMLLSAIQLLL